MHQGAPGPVELLFEGPDDEWMHEREAALLVLRLHDQRRLGRSFEHVERVLGRARHRGEDIDIELAPDHRGATEQLRRLVTEPGDAPADDLDDVRRQVEAFERARPVQAATGLVEVAYGLGQEERVALGPVVQLARGARAGAVDRLAGRRLQQEVDLALGEPVQGDALDPWPPLEGFEQLLERARLLHAPMGPDDEQSHRGFGDL
jgi:hypothetical protein